MNHRQGCWLHETSDTPSYNKPLDTDVLVHTCQSSAGMLKITPTAHTTVYQSPHLTFTSQSPLLSVSSFGSFGFTSVIEYDSSYIKERERFPPKTSTRLLNVPVCLCVSPEHVRTFAQRFSTARLLLLGQLHYALIAVAQWLPPTHTNGSLSQSQIVKTAKNTQKL